jgi:outer membrane protein assembly factor BamB
MHASKAMAAILAALVTGMVASTLLPGCQPPAPPAGSSAPVPDSPSADEPSGDSLSTDDAAPAATEPASLTEPAPPTEPAATEPAPTEPAPAEPAASEPAPATEPAPAEPTAAAEPAKATEPVSTAAAAADAPANPQIKPGDWTMWGGTSLRNNTPIGKNIVGEWAPGEFDRRTGAWNRDEAKNIKWVANLGSQTYGNTVVAGGKVFVGTNNSGGYLKRYPSDIDLGVFLCFDEKDGKFLWQHSSEKLPTGRVHDWPLQGICCSPLVEGERLWFVTSRGEVRCLDINGFHDGKDDGLPASAEPARLFDLRRADDPADDKVGGYVADLDAGKIPADVRTAFDKAGMPLPEGDIAVAKAEVPAPLKKWTFQAKVNGADRDMYLELRGPNLSGFKIVTVDDKEEADVLWVYNMMDKLGTSQHNMCSCSVTALGDILFVNTSNGVDDSHLVIPAPDAPSFIAMDKNSGEVYWTDSTPGRNVLHGQWSSPTVATIDGVPQVIFAGGDAWVYSFRADKGKDGKPELLWKFDANPKDAILELGGRGTRNDVISTPVVYDNKVYFCTGQDPEHGEGDGILWCIDPTKRGDISELLAVNREDPKKPIPVKRVQAVVEADGDLAVPNPNSAVVWKYTTNDKNGDGEIEFDEQFHRSISTVVIKDDLLFVPDFSGLFHCVDAQTGKVHWTYDMLAAAWGSAMIVEDKVYVGDEDGDIAVFKMSADPKVAMKGDEDNPEPFYSEVNMGNAVYCTPIVANGVLYIANNDHVFAIAAEEDTAGE